MIKGRDAGKSIPPKFQLSDFQLLRSQYTTRPVVLSMNPPRFCITGTYLTIMAKQEQPLLAAVPVKTACLNSVFPEFAAAKRNLHTAFLCRKSFILVSPASAVRRA
jgi:hypothetical protein